MYSPFRVKVEVIVVVMINVVRIIFLCLEGIVLVVSIGLITVLGFLPKFVFNALLLNISLESV